MGHQVRRDRRAALGVLAGAIIAFAASCAWAQVPSSSRAQPPTREEIQRQAPRSGENAAARLTVEGDIERAPCPLADPQFRDVTFTLTDVQFSSLRGAAKEDLKPAYSAWLGKSIPIATVCEIRDGAATILRRLGYLAAIQVPPQRIEGGVLRLDVLMAKVTAIQVHGDAGRAESLVAGYLEPLTHDEVFNQRKAERYLLLARDIPGLDVRLALKSAGGAPGEVIGEVSVVSRKADASMAWQNLGSTEVGRGGTLLRGQIYGLTGMGDRTSLSVFATDDIREQRLAQLSHDFRVGSRGLAFSVNATYAVTEPDLGPGGGRITSDTVVAEVQADYPLVRTQARTLHLAGGLDYANQDVRFNGAPLTEDRLSVAFVRLDFDAVDSASIAGRAGYSPQEPRWRLSGTLEARKGLSLFGASDDCGPPPSYVLCGIGSTPLSRIDANPQGGLVRLEGRAEIRPRPRLTLSLTPRLQYAPDPLASYEEYSTGAYTIGRGYDPGVVSGDSGAGLRIEVAAGSLLPNSKTAMAVQPFAFLDQAWVWNGDPHPEQDRISSAGAGVRVALSSGAHLDIMVAKPLEPAPLQTRTGGARALITLSAPLWPWRQH